MAIVQLIYLSRDLSSPATDFWFFDPLNPDVLKAWSPNLNALREAMRDPKWNAGSGWAAGIPTSSWPSESSFAEQPATMGLAIKVAFSLAWSESGQATASQQPLARYWLVHQSSGQILAIRDKLSGAAAKLSEYIADQTQF